MSHFIKLSPGFTALMPRFTSILEDYYDWIIDARVNTEPGGNEYYTFRAAFPERWEADDDMYSEKFLKRYLDGSEFFMKLFVFGKGENWDECRRSFKLQSGDRIYLPGELIDKIEKNKTFELRLYSGDDRGVDSFPSDDIAVIVKRDGKIGFFKLSDN